MRFLTLVLYAVQRPRWSSERDREIFSAKLQIENAPPLKNDAELFAPLYRNISTFKRFASLFLSIEGMRVIEYKSQLTVG